jgi:hypothetical protein
MNATTTLRPGRATATARNRSARGCVQRRDIAGVVGTVERVLEHVADVVGLDALHVPVRIQPLADLLALVERRCRDAADHDAGSSSACSIWARGPSIHWKNTPLPNTSTPVMPRAGLWRCAVATMRSDLGVVDRNRRRGCSTRRGCRSRQRGSSWGSRRAGRTGSSNMGGGAPSVPGRRLHAKRGWQHNAPTARASVRRCQAAGGVARPGYLGATQSAPTEGCSITSSSRLAEWTTRPVVSKPIANVMPGRISGESGQTRRAEYTRWNVVES